MHLVDTSTIRDWRIGRKTKGLRAKPMVSLLVDRSVMSKFLVDTLEAKEPVAANTMFCIGEGNDAWQQSPAKLLKKYDVVNVDEDGWMVCTPKAENSVEFYEVPLIPLSTEPTYVVGNWGETIDGIENLQAFEAGDCIVRNRGDSSDVWIVRRRIWLNTYTEISK